jgi:predicted ATP-dependent serine protease
VGDYLGGSDKRRRNMEKRGLSLAEIQDVPKGNLILLAGPPGAGKSAFCQQVMLKSMAGDQPVIFVWGHGTAKRKRHGRTHTRKLEFR